MKLKSLQKEDLVLRILIGLIGDPRGKFKPSCNGPYCETKIWLISVSMITKQGLELMIIFQVCLGKTISKVAFIKTNQAKEKS